jgi:hypothetical protein
MFRFPAVVAAPIALLGALAWHSPASADSVSDTRAAAKAADLAEALGALRDASSLLDEQKHFSFSATTGHDVRQAGGFMLEFGAQRSFVLKRPDHVRVDVQERDGDSHTTRYDGSRFSVELPDENAYVSIEWKGSIDGLIDALADDFDTPIPLSDLLHTRFVDDLEAKATLGGIVGPSEIAGVACDHVGFVTPGIDVQVWIQAGDPALIRRLILTYKNEPGSPQFWADLGDWKLGGKAPADELFAFSPPKGAEQIPLRAVQKQGEMN